MHSAPNIELMNALAAEIRLRRRELGVSQEELVHRCEVNRTFVAKMELALNQPSLTVLHKLARGLEVDLTELIRRTLARYEAQ